jgi:hypothetical protein
MQTPEAQRLANIILEKAHEFKSLCQGVDEETASRAPAGRWSPKEIVSHLIGPGGIGLLPSFQAFLQYNTPFLDVEAGNHFFTERRAGKSFDDLLAEFDSEYDRIADFVVNLSDEQLNRKAHIPMLKETPLGEYPTLTGWCEAIGSYHLGFHIDQMREILHLLREASAPQRVWEGHEERPGT